MMTEEGRKEPTHGDKTHIILYNQPTMTATRWSSCSNNQGCAFARVGLIRLLLATLGQAQAVDPEVDAKCVTRYKDFQDDHAERSYLCNGYDDRFGSKQPENKESVPSLSLLCEERKVGARGVYRDIDGSDDDFETVFYSVFPECSALETHYGRRLVGEWDGTTATGTFSLVNDTTITAAIVVTGALEIFGVVPAGSETRPAIDGGRTGRWTSPTGHTVFKVTGDATTLVLSNITIRNGSVSNLCIYPWLNRLTRFFLLFTVFVDDDCSL